MASYRDLAGALEALCRSVRNRTISETSTFLGACEALVAEARRGNNQETKWTDFQQASAAGLGQSQIGKLIAAGFSQQQIDRTYKEEIGNTEVWVNSRYQVLRRDVGDGMIYLSIKRLDQRPIRSWRDLQRIKNELVGPECEAVELFPAESRLLDSANQYHLWVFANPEVRMPLGHFGVRFVTEEAGVGEGQEPFDG